MPKQPLVIDQAAADEHTDVIRRELMEQNISPDTPQGRWLAGLLALGERGGEKEQPRRK
jgi:hypothetical protein